MTHEVLGRRHEKKGKGQKKDTDGHRLRVVGDRQKEKSLVQTRRKGIICRTP
jgi:hypothetical protein